MKKSFTLQPFFPEVHEKPCKEPLGGKLNRRFRIAAKNRPSQLALRNIMGFAAACSFQKTEHQGTFEIVIN